MKKKTKKSKKLKVGKTQMSDVLQAIKTLDVSAMVANAMKDLANATNKPKTNAVHTHCTNCNLKLVVPEVESYRCLLCGCKELNTRPWSPA